MYDSLTFFLIFLIFSFSLDVHGSVLRIFFFFTNLVLSEVGQRPVSDLSISTTPGSTRTFFSLFFQLLQNIVFFFFPKQTGFYIGIFS